MIPEGDVLEVGYFLMWFYCEVPNRVSKLTICMRVVTISCILMMAVLTFCNFFFAGFDIALKTLETFSTEFHVLTKYASFAIFRKTIMNFIQHTGKWTLDDASPKLRAELEYTYKSVYRFLLGLSVSTFCTLFTFFFKVITDERTVMMMEFWLPSDDPMWAGIIWCIQCFTLTVAAGVIVGFDSYFAAFCTHLYVQLRILEEKYQNLRMPIDDPIETDVENRRILAECIKHHWSILSFFKNMRTLYSPIFILQFFSTSISACVQLYILHLPSEQTEKTSLIDNANKALYIFILLFEFGFYCIPSEYLSCQLQALTDAIYHSHWTDSKLSLRKDLLIMMIASDKQTAFTAGGFTDVRMSTYTSVFKISFSFFTMMRNIQMEKPEV